MKPIDVNIRQQGKMLVLNWKNTHYNLIVGRNHMLSQVGSLKFQESNQPCRDRSGRQGAEERNQVRRDLSPEVQGAGERNLDREAAPEGQERELEGQKSHIEECQTIKTSEPDILKLHKQKLLEKLGEINKLKKEIKRLTNKYEPVESYDQQDIDELDSEAAFLRKEGFCRTNPQNSANGLNCPKCKVVTKSNAALGEHMKTHDGQLPNLKCKKCNQQFSGRNALENHISSFHEAQLNCYDCQFQASSGSELRKHLNQKSHSAAPGVIEKNLGKTMTCKGCGEEFSEWWNLMNHRRDNHPEKRRRCRNDIKGECDYSDEGPNRCWWRHEKGNSTKENDTLEFNQTCNVCDEMFTSKSEMMLHKKREHKEKVPFCKKLIEGTCEHTAPKCWFRHDLAQNEEAHSQESSKSVFPKSKSQAKPPDMEELKEILKQAFSTILSVKEKIDSMSF